MAVGTGKKIVLAVIVVVGYLIGNHSNDSKKYEELKNNDPSSLSQDDKSFIKTIEDGRAKAEADRRDYQKEQVAEKEKTKPKPLSEKVLLQNDVIFTCKDIARNSLNYPDSFEVENTNSGVDNQNGKQVYYFTLDYSGVNAFNVRGSHTIECYGTIGDPSHSVTYRTFN